MLNFIGNLPLLMNRIKCIDGLRAISIIMVLLAHAGPTMPQILRGHFLFNFLANAGLGVRIFFVLSGYLITKILIIEEAKTGIINIRHFFLRRMLRIFPIFYLYILVVVLLKLYYIPNIIDKVSDVVPALFYVWNYKFLWVNISGNANWFLGHFWSLSMEEQFYLFWPFTFAFFYSNDSRSRFFRVLIAVIVLMPVLRVASYFLMPENRGQIAWMLHTGGDSILIGCLGALIEKTERFKSVFIDYLNNKWLIVFTLLFLFILSPSLSLAYGGAYQLPFGISLDNIFILILLFWIMYIPTIFTKFLNHKVMVNIGTLSYSLYVWQQIFLTNIYKYWFNLFPQNLIIVFLIGYFSYYVIEKPILRLKRKLKPVVANSAVGIPGI